MWFAPLLRPALVALFASWASLALANVVSDMRVVGDEDRTRFVVDLQKNPDFNVLRLANPNRLVIDLPDVEFPDLSEPGGGRGLISDYRYGLIAPGKGRIVLDLAQPVTIVNTFVLDPAPPEPARLVVDMAPAGEADFQAAALQDSRTAGFAAAVPDGPPAIDRGRPVVVLDPGHGGIDSGATGKDGLLEKEVTLKFARHLAQELKAGGKLEPVLTREADDFVSLSARVEVAQRHQARLFISIHADSVAEDYVRGATVYTLSDGASDALAEALAARENRSDILAGLALEDQPDEVADILFDLARRESKNLAIRFAKTLVGDMRGTFPMNANPWRRAAFRVLKAPDVPSVLLELGYLSNQEDEALFRSPDWPVKEARTVARAVEDFFSGNVTAGQ